MLPTSRPRVGWSRTSSAQVAVELAGDDDLLLVAARQRARRSRVADGVRMSYSATATLPRSSIASSLRMVRVAYGLR